MECYRHNSKQTLAENQRAPLLPHNFIYLNEASYKKRIKLLMKSRLCTNTVYRKHHFPSCITNCDSKIFL